MVEGDYGYDGGKVQTELTELQSNTADSEQGVLHALSDNERSGNSGMFYACLLSLVGVLV